MTLPRVWWCPGCGCIKAASHYDIHHRMNKEDGFKWCPNFGWKHDHHGSCEVGRMIPVPVVPPNADWDDVRELFLNHAERYL